MENKLKVGVVIGAFLLIGLKIFAAEPAHGTYEYVTIRWDGKDNTHLIRPGGKVEHIGQELRRAAKPGNTDDRSFYMNVAMNGLAAQGFELAAMTSDEIVMRKGR